MTSFEEEEDEFHDCVELPVEEHSLLNENVSTEKVDSTPDKIREDNEEDIEEIPRQVNVEKSLERALEWKEKGNDAFKNRDFDLAIQCYSMALGVCPDEDIEYKATFFGNRSASYFAEEEFELVVEDCTSALGIKPDYLKVLARRMQTFERLEKFEEALNDAKKLQELDPTYPKIKSIISRLEKLQEEKMQKMKDEAFGKLKELGNSILGNFGMSLDNFKMEQDPATGSWSLSMKK